jgi:hypothetical protein
LYGAETSTLWKVDQKYLESFEIWCWRRMEKISWTDRVRNEEVLHRVKNRNVLHTINRRKANWIGHILSRNCPLKHVIEGKIEGSIEVAGGKTRIRCKQLLDDLKETREYWKLKEEATVCTLWRACFGKSSGFVVRQYGMNE